MTAEFARDTAMTVVILGFFGFVWFGWAQEDPPRSWRKFLAIGSIASLLVAAAGGFLAWQHWSDGTVFGPETSRTFGIVVGIEFVLAGLGAWLLTRFHRRHYISAWIALVVGLHFFPLGPLLGDWLYYVVAPLVTVVALLAVPVSTTRSKAISAVTGVGTGTILLLAALFSLVTLLV